MNKKNCFIKDCLFEVLVLKFNLLCSLPIYIYIYVAMEVGHITNNPLPFMSKVA